MDQADEGKIRQRVELVARAFVARYGWRFVTAESLLAGTLELLPATEPQEIDAEALKRLCRRAASRLLYASCERAGLKLESVTERDRSELAYGDLYSYLRSVAGHMDLGEEREDALQNAMLAIRRNIADCRDPGLFLPWSTTILRRKASDVGRADRDEASIEEIIAQPGGEARLHRAVVTAASGTAAAGDVDFLHVLHDCLHDDEQRMVALFVWVAGFKRRHFAELFDMPLWRYDRIVKATRSLLQECPELLALLRTATEVAK